MNTASTFMTICKCGKRFSLYVPKAMLSEIMHALPAEIAKARECDEQEIKDGEVESARALAEMLGAVFVDAREMSACRQCGADLLPRKILSDAGAEMRGEDLLKEALGYADARGDDGDLPF